MKHGWVKNESIDAKSGWPRIDDQGLRKGGGHSTVMGKFCSPG